MKRYTIRIRRCEAGVNGARIKGAVLARLLRQPVTHHFGSLREESSEVVLIELATDAGGARLLELLRGLEADLPIAVEGLEWGWATPEERTAASGPNAQAPAGQPFIAANPLATARPQEAETHDDGYRRKRWMRMLSGILAIGALVVLVDIRTSQEEPSAWVQFLMIGL
jgi:predicted cobalt transporter CbtA